MTTVSIIVPCYNEQATIQLLLAAIYAQTYPRNELEVVIADGLSTDKTRDEIAAFQKEHPSLIVKVVDNPKRIIPAALNRAIQASRGSVIIRLDAHCVPQANYVEGCLRDLQAGCGDNVGGVWDIRPGSQSWIGRSIAVAAAHPMGVGDARYRYSNQAGPVDTVPFGAFRRALVERVGLFDETLFTNEDYEFNTRIRQFGGTVWLNPAIRSVYFARADLVGLARQYWRYGYWKQRMLRRYPGSLRWRQALPPVFVVSLALLIIISIVFPPARWVLGLELIGYIAVLFTAGLFSTLRRKDPALLAGFPLAVATMHVTWGTGFLLSLVSTPQLIDS